MASSSPPRGYLLAECGTFTSTSTHKQVLNSFAMPVLDSLNNFCSAMAMNARRSQSRVQCLPKWKHLIGKFNVNEMTEIERI
jgi:hypothetical protein